MPLPAEVRARRNVEGPVMKSQCAALVLPAGAVFTTGARGGQAVVPSAGPVETPGLSHHEIVETPAE
jgi:hypothetical protein